MSEVPQNTGDIQVPRDESGRFIEGHSGNPAGKPKGRYSMKTKIINRLKENPDEEKEIIDHLIKNEQALLLQMFDGRPKQSLDGGEDSEGNSMPILGGLANVQSNNSPTQDNSPQQEN